MVLTGKDIYEQAVRDPHYAQLETFAWEHVHPVLAEQYSAIAEKVSAVYIRPLMKALQALEEKYQAKHAATRVLLSEGYAEIDGLLRMHEPSREEAQEREESLQQRIVAFLRSDDEPSPAQQIADMKELITDLVDGLQDCWDNEYSLDELNDLKARAQDLLREEPQL